MLNILKSELFQLKMNNLEEILIKIIKKLDQDFTNRLMMLLILDVLMKMNSFGDVKCKQYRIFLI